MAQRSQRVVSNDVFISYSHKDQSLKQELLKHLAVLERRGLITGWHDGAIRVGNEWEKEISAKLNKAHIILLLISSDFLGSDFCYDIELKRAMERHDTGEARVIPIILRDCDWTGAPFSKLKALPRDGKAVTSRAWANVDEAFTNVAEGIRRAVEELVESQIEHLLEKLGAAESQRNWPSAIKLGDRILALLPDHKDARTRTGRAYFNNCVRKCREQEPYTTLGERDYSYVEWVVVGLSTIDPSEGAQRDLGHAIERDSNQGEFYYWLSATRLGANRVANLERAIELDPNNGKYYYVRSHELDLQHLSKMKEGMGIRQGMDYAQELREQARRRGLFRVNEAAQRDFERAIELGCEDAVKEKQAAEARIRDWLPPMSIEDIIRTAKYKPWDK